MDGKRPLRKRKDNRCSLQITYTKRREGILKKASELSTLCDTDVGLLMFSPTGQLTTYAHKGRVEDIFLRYIEQPDDFEGPLDNEEFLYKGLKHLKYEAEMLDKLGSLEALEKKLRDLNRQKYEAQEKMRSYNPDMTTILSLSEADRHQQFVIDAIRRIEKLKITKLLEKEISPSNPNDVEMPAFEVDSGLRTEESINSEKKRNRAADDHKDKAPLAAAPETQKNWNLQQAEDITVSGGHMP